MKDWTTSEWIAFASVIVAFLGIVATSVFSWLLWKATKKSTEAAVSSAHAAEASTRLAINHDNEQRQLANAMKSQLILDIRSQAEELRAFIVAHQQGHSTVGRMQVIPRKPLVSSVLIGQYFSDTERELINTAWQTYDSYVSDFWTDQDLNIGSYNQAKTEDQKNAARHNVQVKILDLINNLN